MAELVGTIVGVVSLGLQVCSGINVYLGGIQGRKEDIASTVRHCKTTEILLKQTESIRGRLASLPSANTTALQESISAANTELSLLEAYVKKIHAEAPLASSKSVVAKFKEQKKRLLYPFRRDHLNLLDSRLEKANEALQGALQLAGLEVSFDNNDSLRGMETTLGTLAQGFSETSVEMRTSIVELKETTMFSRQDNQAIMEGIAELASMMSAMSSSGAGALLPRMVSKPDTLKRVCDNVEVVESSISVDQSSYSEARSSLAMRSSDEALSIYPESYCRCNARRVTRRRKQQFGPAFILKKDVVERAHLNDCPFAAFDVDKTSNWSAGISVRLFQKLVLTAVTLTMSSTSGAGGFGISPVIKYYNIRNRSLAFKIIDWLTAAYTLEEWNAEEFAELARHGIKALQATFAAKTSLPSDVNYEGDNLLHYVILRAADSFKNYEYAIIDFLVKANVPRDTPGQYGSLPFQEAFMSSVNWECDEAVVQKEFDLLYPDESFIDFDIELTAFFPASMSRKIRYHSNLKNSLTMTKLYAGHPLEPIFKHDKQSLLEKLDKDPSSPDLSTRGAFGDTVLHHLLGWTEGLRIILNRFGESILQKQDIDTPVLASALLWSGHVCTSLRTVECLKTCPCTDSVKLLLEVDSDCVRRAVTQPDYFWLVALATASWRARDLTIEALKDRRQELKEFAIAWLKPHDIDRLALRKPQVLDCYTGEVLKALAVVGVKVPPRLMTEVSFHHFWKPVTGSMYHYICKVISEDVAIPLAESLYSKGFHDIDILDGNGLNPLCIAHSDDFSTWLVEHGASLEKPISGVVDIGSIAAHYVFSNFRYSYVMNERTRRKLAELFRKLPNSKTNLDECICGCSSDGCHPYTKMWKTVLEPSVERGTQEELTKEIRERCTSIEEGWKIPREIKSFCLRACTFAALRLRHTCCRHMVSNGDGAYYRNEVLTKPEESEVQEIREEETVELARLEDLIIEFEGKLDKADCSLAEFFRTEWAIRMDEVLGEIEDQVLTEQDIAGARKLGVFLEVKAEEGSATVEEAGTEEEDYRKVEYWCRRLDALVE